MDIETILQKMGYRKIFNKDGNLSVNGAKAYGKLLDILCNMKDAGIITDKALNQIITEIDKAMDAIC